MDTYVQTAEKQLNNSISPDLAVFFSDRNMSQIQSALIRKIGNLGYNITHQSDDEVFALMFHVYVNTVPHMHQTNAQILVKKMNKEMMDMLVPMVHSNILQYIQLLKDQSAPLSIMPRALSTNVKGTDVLEINL